MSKKKISTHVLRQKCGKPHLCVTYIPEPRIWYTFLHGLFYLLINWQWTRYDMYLGLGLKLFFVQKNLIIKIQIHIPMNFEVTETFILKDLLKYWAKASLPKIHLTGIFTSFLKFAFPKRVWFWFLFQKRFGTIWKMLHSHLIIVVQKIRAFISSIFSNGFSSNQKKQAWECLSSIGGTIHKMMQKISNPFFKEWYGYIHEQNVDNERRVE